MQGLKVWIVLSLAVGAQSICMIEEASNTDSNRIAKCRTDAAFLTKLVFRKPRSSDGVKFYEATRCIVRGCCLDELPRGNIVYPSSGALHDIKGYAIGHTVPRGDLSWYCSGGLVEYQDTNNVSAICEESGWNLLRLQEEGRLCVCPRGQILSVSATGNSSCTQCPVGHTTYRTSPNTCTGPEIVASDRRRKHVFSARVPYSDIGDLRRDARYWRSTGDWYLKRAGGRTIAIIRQRVTSTYVTRARTIPRPPITVAIEPIIEDRYCYKDGGKYDGYINTTVNGDCISGGQSYCTIALGQSVCYCRGSPPSCNTRNGVTNCDVPRCNDQPAAEPELCEYNEIVSGVSLEDADAAVKFNDETEAKRTCDMLGGECLGVAELGSNQWMIVGSISTPGAETYHNKNASCNPYAEHYFAQTWN